MNSSVGPSGDPEMDLAIHETTVAENEKGWLRGPFTHDELNLRHNNRWVLARRFGIRQGDKIRPIDDFSKLGQNLSLIHI